MTKKRYEARVSDNLGKLHDYNLGPSFNTIQECQNYIDTKLCLIEELLSSAFSKILWLNHQICLSGSFIRVYDTQQKRFITGFDV